MTKNKTVYEIHDDMVVMYEKARGEPLPENQSKVYFVVAALMAITTDAKGNVAYDDLIEIVVNSCVTMICNTAFNAASAIKEHTGQTIEEAAQEVVAEIAKNLSIGLDKNVDLFTTAGLLKSRMGTLKTQKEKKQ
jgi:hypothetical protein